MQLSFGAKNNPMQINQQLQGSQKGNQIHLLEDDSSFSSSDGEKIVPKNEMKLVNDVKRKSTKEKGLTRDEEKSRNSAPLTSLPGTAASDTQPSE